MDNVEWVTVLLTKTIDMNLIKQFIENSYIWNGEFMAIEGNKDTLVSIIFWIWISVSIIGCIRLMVALNVEEDNYSFPAKVVIPVYILLFILCFLTNFVISVIFINTTFIGYYILGVIYIIVSSAIAYPENDPEDQYLYANKIYLYFMNKEIQKQEMDKMIKEQQTYLTNEKTFLNGNDPQRIQRKLKGDFSTN